MNILIDELFIVSVALIWFMIFYQLLLTISGCLYYFISEKERKKIENMDFDYPVVTVLIPAHNEEVVIKRTVESILSLDYPADKLDVLVINDSSTDKTGEVLEEISKSDDRLRILTIQPPEGGKGKSTALNKAIPLAKGDYIAVYDADNRPEPDALKHLVRQLLVHPELGAVLGKFRCANARKNLLTSFINIESLSFQWIIQAGRWNLLKVATLPGTNLVIRKKIFEEVGGWDVDALTEDSEFSLQIYKRGYKIKFVPYAVTWEQEPEDIKVWLKQRTRWVRGNNYVILKFMKEIFGYKSKRLIIEVLYMLSLYYIFFLALILSDFLFIGGLLNLFRISVPGPFNQVWILAVVFFFLEIILALSLDKEDKPRNVLLLIPMYITYCQMWIVVLVMGIAKDIMGKERNWVKTVRFEEG